jgi:hypothetical protein
MLSRRWTCTLALAVVTALLGAAQANAQSASRVLAFHPGTAGHPEVAAGLQALTDLGRRGGFLVDPTENASDFTGANLARYRAVAFLNTAGDRLNNEQEGALADLTCRFR